MITMGSLFLVIIFIAALILICQVGAIEAAPIKENPTSVTNPSSTIAAYRLPVIYVYTVVPAVCRYGLPEYIRYSLEQAARTQSDCDVILASNFGECPKIMEKLVNTSNVLFFDTTSVASDRTKQFANLSKNIFESDYGGELWVTSALRFFQLEDMMILKGYKEMMHIEADNLLYGKLTSILKTFRDGYKGLAATPLNSNVTFITASVLWIASLAALKKFNDFLLDLATPGKSEWKSYLSWLRPYGCCKRGGIDPDSHGNGIKPFAINEMSMLAYYRHRYPGEFSLFPVVPKYDYFLNKHVCNMSDYGPDGREVGPPTGDGIWDPNSWGQFLGGTSVTKGRNKGFTDRTHIAGQAIGTSKCKSKMICIPRARTYSGFRVGVDDQPQPQPQPEDSDSDCITAPHVRCMGAYNGTWTPLWNLHVHSKNTQNFISEKCSCR